MTALPRHKHSEMLRVELPLPGGRILDVGCGDGGLVRFLTREGAEVVGLESSEAQLRRAEAVARVGGESYLLGRGEELPFAERSFDAVVFSNSLHHVAPERMDRALSEAGRVLRPGGVLYVAEPLAEGPLFELMKPVEDESAVRAAAYAALQRSIAPPVFDGLRETLYVAAAKYRDFEAFKAQFLRMDSKRRAVFEAAEESLRAGFLAAAVRRDDAAFIDQPFRLTLSRRL
ncbi:MAG: class I SAM-dependent methyltransferase [Kiloniellales bacterium]|nr:class I SAM-dependent methyltransferase [Kiloniellales bacterium]